MIDALIFSRNRPMQLHCLLDSIEKLTNLKRVSVLHRYDAKYLPGLDKVRTLHANVAFIQEVAFHDQVIGYLKAGPPFCVFFVDDMIVKDKFDVFLPCRLLQAHPECLTFSLRLGTHLTFCYMTNSVQHVPDGTVSSGLFQWNWRGASYDWGYPLSLDGHVFRRSELQTWTAHLRFDNPNQLESQMQTIPRRFAVPSGCLCHLASKVFNMPLNKVQQVFPNRSEGGSVDELYEAWMSGKALDYTSAVGFMNASAHQPLPLPFREVAQVRTA